MDAVQNKVQDAISKMINKLDVQYLRRMQADMYKCSASCCENSSYSMEDVQNCVDNCSKPIQIGQKVLGHELQGFQDRLQRCAMDCQDSIRDKMGAKANDSDMTKHRYELEQCVVKCGDTHVALVPAMMKRLEETLKQK